MATYLLDTNIVLRFIDLNSLWQPVIRQALNTLQARGDMASICPQTIYEFWAVASRPTEVNGFGWDTKRTKAEVDELLKQFPLLPETPELFEHWLELVTQYQVSGKQVHDIRIAALALVHGCQGLITLNVEDFKRYGVKALHPSEI